jgi:hypothetical protein
MYTKTLEREHFTLRLETISNILEGPNVINLFVNLVIM